MQILGTDQSPVGENHNSTGLQAARLLHSSLIQHPGSPPWKYVLMAQDKTQVGKLPSQQFLPSATYPDTLGSLFPPSSFFSKRRFEWWPPACVCPPSVSSGSRETYTHVDRDDRWRVWCSEMCVIIIIILGSHKTYTHVDIDGRWRVWCSEMYVIIITVNVEIFAVVIFAFFALLSSRNYRHAKIKPEAYAYMKEIGGV